MSPCISFCIQVIPRQRVTSRQQTARNPIFRFSAVNTISCFPVMDSVFLFAAGLRPRTPSPPRGGSRGVTPNTPTTPELTPSWNPFQGPRGLAHPSPLTPPRQPPPPPHQASDSPFVTSLLGGGQYGSSPGGSGLGGFGSGGFDPSGGFGVSGGVDSGGSGFGGVLSGGFGYGGVGSGGSGYGGVGTGGFGRLGSGRLGSGGLGSGGVGSDLSLGGTPRRTQSGVEDFWRALSAEVSPISRQGSTPQNWAPPEIASGTNTSPFGSLPEEIWPLT